MKNGHDRRQEGVSGAAFEIAGYLLSDDHVAANKAIERALDSFGPDELANTIRVQMNMRKGERK